MPKKAHSTKVPVAMQSYYSTLIKLTDEYCQTTLNEEYRDLVCVAAAALCRKRPSPVVKGHLNVWACAIVYAIGSANFLFDKTTTPYVSPGEIAEAFSVNKSTAKNKARMVRELLNLSQFDHRWMLPSLIANNAMAWMITYNGFIVDARQLPREIQEVAYEKGLIPYVPEEVIS